MAASMVAVPRLSGADARIAGHMRVRLAFVPSPDTERAQLSPNNGQPRSRTGELGEDRQEEQEPGHRQYEAWHGPDEQAVQPHQGRGDEASVHISSAVIAVEDTERMDGTAPERRRARSSGIPGGRTPKGL